MARLTRSGYVLTPGRDRREPSSDNEATKTGTEVQLVAFFVSTLMAAGLTSVDPASFDTNRRGTGQTLIGGERRG